MEEDTNRPTDEEPDYLKKAKDNIHFCVVKFNTECGEGALGYTRLINIPANYSKLPDTATSMGNSVPSIRTDNQLH